jgi:predicted protein tyrosine phosphatase
MVERHKPARVVSALDPGSDFPELGPTYEDRHLRLEFHDVHQPMDPYVMPAPKHIDQLLQFIGEWNPEESLLVHCRAGIGRSPAMAFITACFHNPNTREQDIATVLRRASPLARPNEMLIRLADDVMGRKGQMIAAITETDRALRWLNPSENDTFQIPSIFPRPARR